MIRIEGSGYLVLYLFSGDNYSWQLRVIQSSCCKSQSRLSFVKSIHPDQKSTIDITKTSMNSLSRFLGQQVKAKRSWQPHLNMTLMISVFYKMYSLESSTVRFHRPREGILLIVSIFTIVCMNQTSMQMCYKDQTLIRVCVVSKNLLIQIIQHFHNIQKRKKPCQGSCVYNDATLLRFTVLTHFFHIGKDQTCNIEVRRLALQKNLQQALL